jgi:hypothetical protein
MGAEVRTVLLVLTMALFAGPALGEPSAAWVHRKYAKDPSLYELETEARNARRGVWSVARDGARAAVEVAGGATGVQRLADPSRSGAATAALTPTRSRPVR